MEVEAMNRDKQSTLQIFFRYLIPSMLGMMLVAVYTFTDTFVVGRELGPIALGAMGVCTPILTVTYALGFLCGMGGGAQFSIRIGKRDKEGANQIYSASLILLVFIGAVLAVFGNLFAEPLAYFLGALDENIGFVMPYMRCLLVYIPGFMFDVFIMTYMKNEGNPHVALIATSTGTGLNIVLDCLFVFVFKWGMFGAAFATCIGSVVSSLINIVWIFRKKLNLIPHLSAVKWKFILLVAKTGFSEFILESSLAIVTFVFILQANRYYGLFGSSIYTMIMNWSLIFFNLMMGIAQSVQPLISLSYGEGSEDKVKSYLKYSMVSSAIAGVIFLVGSYAFTEPLIRVFSDSNAELIALTVSCMRLYIPAYLIMGIGIPIGVYFQASGKSAKAFTITLSRGVLLPIVFALLLPAIIGRKEMLWIAVPLAELFTSVVAIIFLCTEKHKKGDHTRQKSSQVVVNSEAAAE